MQCLCEGGLHYDAPSKGDYGICRMGLMVPESIELFVGPSACGRHGALGAMKNGYKDRIFYLYLSQSDIVGGYDHLIGDAIEKVLSNQNKKPKVIMMIFTCIDDLIGTDHDALKEELTARFPGIVFQSSHMNPIKTNTNEPPALAIQRDIYRTIATHYKNNGISIRDIEKDSFVNILGAYEPLPETCELHSLARLRHVSNYSSFGKFTEMAFSKLNLVLTPLGIIAAKEMEKCFNIPYLEIPVTYDLSEIDADYQKIKDFLHIDASIDFSENRKKAEQAIQKTLEIIGNYPIIVDSSATSQPFGMAMALIKYGFNVIRIEAECINSSDRSHMEWLMEHHPEVELFRPDSHNAVLFDHRKKESISIGIQAAYMADSIYIADLFSDLKMFGYDGVVTLMTRLQEAYKKPRDLKQLINEYGLVV
ncbi:nitrogenase component 1 [Butyrivibrio sp.]|uniref:nitrogenase component 1 n=1 Tax=Butyrivibrio sp. TaxID=28121 RepID=UPI0025C39A67|nr:nitrogenase component 1 [Butyrivibrio sp.]MBE5838831.1 oxidoreductase [Butyrivibrio sp.]